MHERGEQLPFKDPYEQGLQTVLGITERFKDAQYPTYTQLSWSPDRQTIIGSTTREIIDVERDLRFDRDWGTISEYAITFREWTGSTPPDTEPPVETRAVIDYQTGRYFKMDEFTGRPTTPANLLEPFFDLTRCNSEERQRQLVAAVSGPGVSSKGELRYLMALLRERVLGNYEPERIDRYARITEDIEDIPAPFDRAGIARFATSKLVNALAPQGRRPSQENQATEHGRIRAVALKLEETNLFDTAFFASPHAYKHPVFSEILHRYLQSDRREATLRSTRQDPYVFAQKYMSTILGIYATNPDRHTRNAQLALRDTAEPAQRAYVNPSQVIETANKITARQNNIAQLPPLRSVLGLGTVGEAFYRILSITRQPNTEHTEADDATDLMHAEIVDMILESVMQREIGRKVITVKELAEAYPDATDTEFTHLKDALQNGTPYAKLPKLYRQLKRDRQK